MGRREKKNVMSKSDRRGDFLWKKERRDGSLVNLGVLEV
jgi:hypothetical protein